MDQYIFNNNVTRTIKVQIYMRIFYKLRMFEENCPYDEILKRPHNVNTINESDKQFMKILI